MEGHPTLRNRTHTHLGGSVEAQNWSRPKPIGANGGSMGSAAAGSTNNMMLTMITLVGVVAVGAAFGFTSGFLFPPILRDIDSLLGKIDNCHCTDFPDDTFAVFDADNPETFIRFSASNITINASRTYLWPDKNGTVALTSDLHPPQTVFTDGEFAIVHEFVPSREIMFDVSGISNSTTRTFAWQDTDGIVALVADIPVLTSIFLVRSPFCGFQSVSSHFFSFRMTFLQFSMPTTPARRSCTTSA